MTRAKVYYVEPTENEYTYTVHGNKHAATSEAEKVVLLEDYKQLEAELEVAIRQRDMLADKVNEILDLAADMQDERQ